jgi:hypothetical protein
MLLILAVAIIEAALPFFKPIHLKNVVNAPLF